MTLLNSLQIADDKINLIDDELESVLVTPGKNCLLVVSGRKVSTPVFISRNDDVSWLGRDKLDPPFQLEPSPDRLHVCLTVYADCHSKWTASLEYGRDGWIVNCVPEPDMARPVTVQDVMLQYREQKFRAAVDRSAIERALKEIAAEPVVIASGEAATEGRHGWVEAHFPLDEEVPFEESGDKLNYREKRRIPIIRPGELMATIHPPVAGQPGTDVWGRLIVPKPTRAVNCRFKQNVREEDGKVYADITGRPSMIPGISPVLEVVPVYTVPGDVDLDFGHVRFEGDVIVLGNVMETMKVTAAQRIVVHGGVYGSELVAGGSVHVDQTVRKSKVYAGQRGALAQQLKHPLHQLQEQAVSAEKSRKLLEQEAKNKKKTVQTEDILYHLLLNYYPDILKLAKHILRTLEAFKGYLPEELTCLQETLDRLVYESTFQFQIKTWEAVLEELHRCIGEKLAACFQEEALVLQTSDLSYLEINGDVVFTGKGSTHSHITASGRILFTKPNASCRGGTLHAGEVIVAEHLGSLSGSKTRCRAGKRITARTVQHCDIQIEGPTRYVEETTQIEYYKEGNQTLSRHRA